MRYQIRSEDGAALVGVDGEALDSLEDLISAVAEAERERCANVVAVMAASITTECAEKEMLEAVSHVILGIEPAEGLEFV